MSEKLKYTGNEQCDKNGNIICSVGGEALMEGIMMRAPNGYAQVVRNPQGELVIEKKRQLPFGAGNKFLSLPVVRGSIRLADSLVVGMRALFNSAEISATEDDPAYTPTKFDLWIEKKLGDKAMNVIMGISLVLALIISVTLFFILPLVISSPIEKYLLEPYIKNGWLIHFLSRAVEGVVRILIFMTYMFAVSKMKDIRRVFMYHGAEHKTIHCYEQRLDLTVENVRKMSKHHPRCGTAFLFVVMIISILLFAIVPSFSTATVGYSFYVPNGFLAYILNILLRIILIPVVAGIAYEFNRYAGAHDNALTKILRAPGMAMQRFTTVEPEDDMIELAIVALTEALNLDNETPDYSAKDTVSEEEDAVEGKASEENIIDEASGETAKDTETIDTDTEE
ncbi:MAG: DUF1385 domain-containing protein [Ruminococcaceae bacterium]|nr:DUF1385 domain-containing protein [Oscillospiraceae bacterium]